MKKPKYKKDFEPYQSSKTEKNKNKALVWTIFVALIMITSVIGFLYVSQGEEAGITYNDHKFARKNNMFSYEQDGKEFLFRYFPNELESISNLTDLSGLKKPMIYLTFDPNSTLVQPIDLLRFELSNDLPNLNVYLKQGVTSESDTYSLPVIDCKDASSGTPVIKIVKANETSITKEDNCFLFSAKNDYDLARQKDLIVYILLGII